VLFTPTVLLYRWVRKSQLLEHDPATLDSLINTYAIGFLPGSIVVMILESILMVVFVVMVFGSEIAAAQNTNDKTSGDTDSTNQVLEAIGSSPGKAAFLAFLVSFFVAGLCEESLKYFIAQRYRKLNIQSTSMKNIVLYGAFGALGFSAIENWGYTMQGGTSWGLLLFTALTRILYGTTLHTLTGTLIGIGIAKRDFVLRPMTEGFGAKFMTWLNVIGIPILIHGIFDFQAFLLAGIAARYNWPSMFCFPSDQTNVLPSSKNPLDSRCFGVAEFISLLIDTGLLIWFAFFVKKQYFALPWQFNRLERDEEDSLGELGAGSPDSGANIQ
jgi:RsiW-degrading membrane proteinase PrsW (M82 family)